MGHTARKPGMAVATLTDNYSKEEKEDEGSFQFHPLQDSWVYHLLCHEHSTKNWDEKLRKIATFSTIEHFWSVHLHTDKPSQINNGNDLYVFKEGIQPQWEDPMNENGGRWLMNIPTGDVVDKYWEELLILLMSSYWDTDEEAKQICGAVFQSRSRGHKLAVWLTDCNDQPTIMRIGQRIKERLEFPEIMYFQSVSEQKVTVRGKNVTAGRFQI